MDEIASALLIMVGIAFVPLLIPVLAAALGAVGDRWKTTRTSPAERAVLAARARSARRQAVQVSAPPTPLDRGAGVHHHRQAS